jgi:hypothetical protein
MCARLAEHSVATAIVRGRAEETRSVDEGKSFERREQAESCGEHLHVILILVHIGLIAHVESVGLALAHSGSPMRRRATGTTKPLFAEQRSHDRKGFDMFGEPGARDVDEDLEAVGCEVNTFLGKVFGRKVVERFDLDCVARRSESEQVVAAEFAGDVADELLGEI